MCILSDLRFLKLVGEWGRHAFLKNGSLVFLKELPHGMAGVKLSDMLFLRKIGSLWCFLP